MVLAIVKDGKRVENAEIGETVDIVPNQTPFYGESGGQIGDTGKLTTLKGLQGEVEDTAKPLGRLHVLRTKVAKGELSVARRTQLVDAEAAPSPANPGQRTCFIRRAPSARNACESRAPVAPTFRFDFSTQGRGHATRLSRSKRT